MTACLNASLRAGREALIKMYIFRAQVRSVTPQCVCLVLFFDIALAQRRSSPEAPVFVFSEAWLQVIGEGGYIMHKQLY